MSDLASLRPPPTSSNPLVRLFRGETAFDFCGRWKIWFAISGLLIVIGWASVAINGVNFSIEFKGGTSWEVATNASVTEVHDTINSIGGATSALRQATIQVLTDQSGQRTIEVQAAAAETTNAQETDQVTNALARLAHTTPDQVTQNDIGPSWGSSITRKAIEAVIVFLIVVAVFIWLLFEGKMAIAALIAVIHDILVSVGIYSLTGLQVSPDAVIAFLTVLGYSLYDHIVVFDRIRENTRGLAASGRMTYSDTVNLSVNQTLARSLNTSLVAIIPILSIVVIGAGILGASALEDFGVALALGLTTGALASLFIASPLLALLKEREVRYSQIRTRLASRGARARLTPAAVAAARGGTGGSRAGASRAGGSRAGASRTTARSGDGGSAGRRSGRLGMPAVGRRGADDAEERSSEQLEQGEPAGAEAAMASVDVPVEDAPLARPRKRTAPRVGAPAARSAAATLATAAQEPAERDGGEGAAGEVEDGDEADDASAASGDAARGGGGGGGRVSTTPGWVSASGTGSPRGNRPPPRPRKKGRRR